MPPAERFRRVQIWAEDLQRLRERARGQMNQGTPLLGVVLVLIGVIFIADLGKLERDASEEASSDR